MIISIIIPLYNHGKFLKECLDSIKKQKTNYIYEIIINDDCSTDNSYTIAKNLKDQYNFLLYQSPKNLKLAGCRNYAISKCNGDYIICLDPDDKIPENYIEANMRNIINYQIDVSYNNSKCFGDNNKLYNWPEFDENILRRSPFIHCTSMFKYEIWDYGNKFNESMLYGWEDYDFWLNACKNGYRFKKCNDTFLWYRQSSDSMTIKDTRKNQEKIIEQLRKNHPNYYLG